MVGQTLADFHREQDRSEVRITDRKRTLLEQLRLRFSLPAEVAQAIKATQDADILAEWLRGVATAKTLDSIGIRPPN